MIDNASVYSPVRSEHGTHLLTSSSQHYSAFLDESYFSVLVSPRQSRTFSVVKLVCNTVFVLLLGVKLKFNGLPWITVFLPTLLSNAITFMTIKEEMKYIWATMGSDMTALCRPVAYACDAIGSLAAKIVLLTFLMTKPKDYFNTETSASPRSVWTTALTPLWIFVGLSTILRLIPYYPISATRAYKTKHLLAMLLSTLAYFLFRGLQPLLLSLRMDNIVEHRWSIIFAPSWVLTFFGLACSVLMISLSPFVNGFTNGDFRVATQRLLYISAFQMTAISVASIFFLVLVTQKLDFRDNALTGWNHDSVRVLAPILTLFVALILTQPLLARTMLRYQQMVVMRNMTQHRPTGPDDGTGDPSQNIGYRKVEKITWLMQTTQSGTTYTVTDGRDVSHLLAHSSSPGGETVSLSPSASFTSIATAAGVGGAGAVVAPGRSTMMLQHDAVVTHDDDQRVHEHLDIFSSWFTPSSYHGKSPKKTSGRVQPMGMKHGDIELGPMKSDTLDTELPSPTLSASSSFVGNTDGSTAALAISPFLTDRAFDTGMNPCVVCMARPINTVLMTCGHAVVCLHCVLLLGKRKQTAHCPVCRAQIQSWFHLQQAPFEVASATQSHHNKHHDKSTTAGTNIVRLAVASREYQLQFPPSSTATAAAPSATTTPHHHPLTVAESVNAAHVQHFSHNHYQQRAQAAEHWSVIDYQLHVPAHDALLDILFP